MDYLSQLNHELQKSGKEHRYEYYQEDGNWITILIIGNAKFISSAHPTRREGRIECARNFIGETVTTPSKSERKEFFRRNVSLEKYQIKVINYQNTEIYFESTGETVLVPFNQIQETIIRKFSEH